MLTTRFFFSYELALDGKLVGCKTHSFLCKTLVNTGDFMGKKVTKEITLGVLEAIVENKAKFKKWGSFSDIEIMEWEGFVPDMNDSEYLLQLRARMKDRVNEIMAFAVEKGGYDKLPDDALEAIQKVVEELNLMSVDNFFEKLGL